MSSQIPEGLVKGLHHITLVTSNQEVNRRFYTEVLGLRRVKLTVNQDDIFHRHLFYADEKGTTGSAITFFEWPQLPKGETGLTSPHHLCYNVPSLDALPSWVSWLRSKSVSLVGPLQRDGRVSLYLRDPDGVIIELTATNDERESSEYLEELTGNLPIVSEITGKMRLTSFHHASPVTTDPDLILRFFDKLLGLKSEVSLPNPDQQGTSILAIGNGERSDFLRYLSSSEAADGFVGAGSIHHIAMAVEEDEDQLRILRRLNEVGIQNSGIIDRFWFHSLYFRDPEGNLLEIATRKPGYTADEPLDKLGSHLVLPPWVEPKRKEIEAFLEQTDKKNHGSWPPSYPATPSPPEVLRASSSL